MRERETLEHISNQSERFCTTLSTETSEARASPEFNPDPIEEGVRKDDEHLVLRQMFVVEDERRRGFAQQMVTHWVEKHERFRAWLNAKHPHMKLLLDEDVSIGGRE